MFAVDVSDLPETGGSTFVVIAGLFVLVAGVIVTRWVRQSAGRLSVVVAPLVLLGGCAPATTVPSATTTVAVDGYSVGDTGPGGGIVFYVASGTFTQTGATGSMCTTACKYLEAAPTNWFSGGDPRRHWSTDVNSGIAATGADATGIGSGYQNSLDIVAQSGNEPATSAAVLARSNTTGNKTDWFLPSWLELNELCKYARNQTTGNTSVRCAWSGTLRTGFASDGYWSSSEAGADTAWSQYFANGSQGNTNKSYSGYVRPVRAF